MATTPLTNFTAASTTSATMLAEQQRQQELARQQAMEAVRASLEATQIVAPIPPQEATKLTRTAEVKAAYQEYQAAAQANNELANRVTTESTSMLDEAFNFRRQVDEQLEAERVLRTQQADLNARAAQAALPEMEKAAERFRGTVTGQDSVDRLTQLQASVAEQQAKIRDAELSYANGNILQKAWASMRLVTYRETLAKRQNALDFENRSRIQSAQAFGQELAGIKTASDVVFAQEQIQLTQKMEASTILLDNLTKKRANLQTTVSELQGIYNLSRASVTSLQDKLGVLNAQGVTDRAAYQSILQGALQQEAVERSALARKELAASQEGRDFFINNVWKGFQEASPNFKGLSGEAVLAMSPQELNRLGLDVPLAAYSQMVMQGSTFPYSTARLATQAGQQLTPIQQTNTAIARQAVDTYNNSVRKDFISKQVAKGASATTVERALANADSAESKQLAASLIDPENPKDWTKVDALVRTQIQELSTDATSVWEGEAFVYPNMSDSFNSKEVMDMFMAEVPKDVQDFLASGELDAINTRIAKYADFERVEKEIVARFNLAMSNVQAADNQSQALQTQLNNIKLTSQALAAHYKVSRQGIAKTQYPMLQSTIIRSNRLGMGASGQTLVNFESPEIIEARLKTRFLEAQSKLRAQQTLNTPIRMGSGAGIGGR